MPVLQSSYKAPLGFKNRHVQTIYSSVVRKIAPLQYVRERISTMDGDFLDLDWIVSGSDKLVIISHGLEGSSDRSYVKGAVSAFVSNGFDCLAWNFRGCSGAPNKKPYSYHSGFSEDLSFIVSRISNKKHYKEIYLVGFSVGGNITLKYLSESQGSFIKAAVVYSVPIDLKESALILGKIKNTIYMQYFLHQLRKKIWQKSLAFPEDISTNGLWKIRDFKQFDERYTAPLFNYTSADEYWEKNSSINMLNSLKTPTLLISSQDDPFLGKNCYPYDIAKGSNYLFLETPCSGGHVGFVSKEKQYWSESRAIHFFNTELN